MQMNRTTGLVRTYARDPARKDDPVNQLLRRPLHVLAIGGLAAAFALPLVAHAGAAAADVRVRVRGAVHIRAPHVRVHVRAGARGVIVRDHRVHVTPPPRHRLHIRGGVYVGGSVYVGGYATPPPPPPAYDCDVPAYYYSSPPPANPPVVVAPAPVVEPMGPRLGLGVFAGGVKTADTSADDLGLFARFRMTRGLALEGELSRTRSDLGDARRVGGALVWDLSSRSTLSPLLLGGIGSWDGSAYAEVGAGLTWRLSDRLHIAGDLRAGAHDVNQPDAVAFGGTGPVDTGNSQAERYTRARLAAILYF